MDFTTSNRIKRISETRNFINQKIISQKKSVAENTCFTGLANLMERLGKASVEGEAYVFSRGGDSESNSTKVAVKIFKKAPEIELTAMFMLKDLITKQVCPNLPLYYDMSMCNDCFFSNTKKPRKCFAMFSEFALLGDLDSWMKNNTDRTENVVFNALFQIYAGLFSIYKNYNMRHNDLHTGNVLVHKASSGGYWNYILDDRAYHVPCLGYVCVLWDFGMCVSEPRITGDPYFVKNGVFQDPENYVAGNVYIQSVDHRRITDGVSHLCEKYRYPKNIVDRVRELSHQMESRPEFGVEFFMKEVYKFVGNATGDLIEVYSLIKDV